MSYIPHSDPELFEAASKYYGINRKETQMPVTVNATVKEVKEFFHTDERPMTLKEMKAEWINGDLTKEDKEQIMAGIGNGSLTY